MKFDDVYGRWYGGALSQGEAAGGGYGLLPVPWTPRHEVYRNRRRGYRRKFGRAFEFEAVRLVRERGISAAQAVRNLDVHANVLCKWVRAFAADPRDALRIPIIKSGRPAPPS